MEKILIVSDTHGRIRNLQTVLERSGKIDLLLHLGDVEGGEWLIKKMASCPVEMIAGNNDFMSGLDSEKVLEIGKYRVFMTHGHRYHVHYSYEWVAEAAEKRNCQIALCGHTHVPGIEYFGGVTVVNPGSLTLPRPMTRKPSYVLMDIDRFGDVHFTINYVE